MLPYESNDAVVIGLQVVNLSPVASISTVPTAATRNPDRELNQIEIWVGQGNLAGVCTAVLIGTTEAP